MPQFGTPDTSFNPGGLKPGTQVTPMSQYLDLSLGLGLQTFANGTAIVLTIQTQINQV